MPRALSLVLSLALGGCTPLAVTAVVGGGVTTIASMSAISKKCDGEGCAYTRALGLVGLAFGISVAAAGGIALAAE